MKLRQDMKMRELIDVVLQNPELLEEELSVTAQIKEITGGPYDGAIEMSYRPVKSIHLGIGGISMLTDPNSLELKEIQIRHISKRLILLGEPPDIFKNLLSWES